MVDQASPDIDTPDPSNGVLASVDKADPAAAVQNDDLLGELARAMHQAATSQYERLNDDLAQRRAQQVEAISAHADSEIENLKAASEADVNGIDSWAKSETEKIKLERLRRIDARREQLAGQLDRQETIKQRQVFAIEVAIDAHRNEVDLFFGRMEREADPAAIARIASTMPAFPSLADIADEAGRSAAGEFASLDRSAELVATVDATAMPVAGEMPAAAVADAMATEEAATSESTSGVVEAAAVEGTVESAPAATAPAATAEDATAEDATAEDATAEDATAEDAPERAAASLESDPGASVSESRLMAVMDPDASASPAENPHPWEAPYAVSVAAGTGGPEAEAEPAPEPSSRVGSTLLRTVRAIRPMSGERHDRDGDDR